MSSPLLSVITINYNNVVGLERTLKSVCAQKNCNFEFLVIDGDSNDGSKEIIEKYESKLNIKISEPDKGIYNAMNKGIAKSSGSYLLFINSGDELNGEDALQNAMPLLDGTDIIFGNLMLISKESENLKLYPDKLTFQYFLNESLPHPATFIKKKLLNDAGGFDEHLKVCSDWKFFMIALFKSDASYKHISKTLSRFYLDGLSSSEKGREIIVHEKKQILKTHFAGLLDLVDEWQETRYLKTVVESSRLIKYAKKLGFLKPLR